MGAYVGHDVVDDGAGKTASAQPAVSSAQPVGPVSTPAGHRAASILALQRAAGNQATIRALRRDAARRPPRVLARCGTHCACAGCSDKDGHEEQEDRVSSTLRRAVLQRQADAGAGVERWIT
jgi:hypothetical protein